VIDDASFRVGMVLRCKMLCSGELVPMRRWTERVAEDLWHALFPMTGLRVKAVNVDRGIITMEDAR
jgi:hypothetical protein